MFLVVVLVGFGLFVLDFFIGFFSTLGCFHLVWRSWVMLKVKARASAHKVSTVSTELHTQTNTHAHAGTQAPLAVVSSFISHHLDKPLP